MLLLKRKETLVWAFLLCLTVLSFYVSDTTFSNKHTLHIPILVVSGLKFFAISFYFMELHEAHLVWKVCILLFLALTIGGILVLV